MRRTRCLPACFRCRRPAYYCSVPFHKIGMTSTLPLCEKGPTTSSRHTLQHLGRTSRFGSGMSDRTALRDLDVILPPTAPLNAVHGKPPRIHLQLVLRGGHGVDAQLMR